MAEANGVTSDKMQTKRLMARDLKNFRVVQVIHCEIDLQYHPACIVQSLPYLQVQPPRNMCQLV